MTTRKIKRCTTRSASSGSLSARCANPKRKPICSKPQAIPRAQRKSAGKWRSRTRH
uniref:Uncharacterized protein n=1 Tax=Siphoviridae sp. ctd9R8 TaxID=2825576 RepID=A0A8S5PV11_9CAUD|nr:MAG TPA: hypothetical protein [Siphoviridae sp. ctd9R8]